MTNYEKIKTYNKEQFMKFITTFNITQISKEFCKNCENQNEIALCEDNDVCPYRHNEDLSWWLDLECNEE